MTSGPIKITIPEIFVKIVSFNSADSATAASAITNSEKNNKNAQIDISYENNMEL